MSVNLALISVPLHSSPCTPASPRSAKKPRGWVELNELRASRDFRKDSDRSPPPHCTLVADA